MFAIVKTGGKQYRVAENDVIVVERLGGEAGDSVAFEEVLLVGDDKKTEAGTPLVSGATVAGEILEQARGDKVLIFKKKRRKTYRRTRGHRQDLSVVRITEILTGGKKPSGKKAAAPKKAAPEKSADKPAEEKAAASEAKAESKAAPKDEAKTETKSAPKKSETKTAEAKSGEKKTAAKKPAAKKTETKSASAKSGGAKKAPAKKTASKTTASKKADDGKKE
jgi:large subunit ribosomal protein L21